jgi:hypothetical protein
MHIASSSCNMHKGNNYPILSVPMPHEIASVAPLPRNDIDNRLEIVLTVRPLTLPSPPKLGERVGVRGFMVFQTNMGTLIIHGL